MDPELLFDYEDFFYGCLPKRWRPESYDLRKRQEEELFAESELRKVILLSFINFESFFPSITFLQQLVLLNTLRKLHVFKNL